MAIKSIGYAYATSAIATRLKAARTGCYYVETKADELATGSDQLIGPFETLEQAGYCAALLPHDWSRYSRRAA